MQQAVNQAPSGLPWVKPRQRKLGMILYKLAWVRNKHSDARELPEGTETVPVSTVFGEIRLHVMPAKKSKGAVLLVHPDRRYGGYWFVREGWVAKLHAAHKTVAWFDQPGYGQGVGGSPYLAENVIAMANWLVQHEKGPTDIIGLSLGAFATAIAVPHLPEVRKVILESPYSTFDSWYEDKGFSLGKVATKTFGLLFRGSKKLNAPAALKACPQEVLVSYSEADVVTPPSLTLRAAGEANVSWYVSKNAEHLGLWSEKKYQQTILNFLR